MITINKIKLYHGSPIIAFVNFKFRLTRPLNKMLSTKGCYLYEKIFVEKIYDSPPYLAFIYEGWLSKLNDDNNK